MIVSRAQAGRKKAIKFSKTPPRHVFWGTKTLNHIEAVIGVTDKGDLCRLSFLRGRKPVEIAEEWQAEWKRTYFSILTEDKDVFSLPLLLIGSAFQQTVWQEVMKIGHGETASYGTIARRIGHPGAARAVGTACGNNYLAYLVPCHRIVAAHGLGGYGKDGLEAKRALLKAEGILFSS